MGGGGGKGDGGKKPGIFFQCKQKAYACFSKEKKVLMQRWPLERGSGADGGAYWPIFAGF